MKEIEILIEKYRNHNLEWIPTLQVLSQLQDDGKIVLYAGTYSFQEALKRPLCDSAEFYFYTVSDRSGYCFYINRMGMGIKSDNEIFMFKHKYLYNKRHLSNCFFGEKDFRSGEYFNRKKKNELEKNPKKYIETLFYFLENKGFKKSHGQVNCENWFSYEKDDFHITINYDCYKKMRVWFDIYYKTWDNEPIIKHLYIKDEHYKLRFQNYDNLNCKEQLDLVAEYLSEYVDDVISANVNSRRYY